MNELIDTTDLTDKEYLSVSEVRQTLGISENTLYRYLRKGHFSPIKYKNKNYFFQNPEDFTKKFLERYKVIDNHRRELELLPTKESRLERISELLSGSHDE